MAKFSPTKSDSVFISSANKRAATQSPWSRNARFPAPFLPKKWLDIKDDQHFAEFLNRFRTGSQTDKDVNCINFRLISPSADNYPVDVLHMWAENVPVNEYNNKGLEQLSSPLFILKANDQYPSQVTQKDINTVPVSYTHLTLPTSDLV